MPYTQPATAETPMFVLYLIDLSQSMGTDDFDGRTRLDVVSDALKSIRRTMISRSRRGDTVRPRYAVSMLGYSDSVVDLLGGVKQIDELETMQLPTLNLQRNTNTAAAFQAAYQLMSHYLPNIQDCPAPLVCHLTDGGYNVGGDPIPIAESIKQLSVADGNVLLENIYIGAQLLHQPITNPQTWPGVLSPAEIREPADMPYIQNLWHMSSSLPESYAAMLAETEGYQMQAGAKMLIPAETSKLVALAFAMSGATPITQVG